MAIRKYKPTSPGVRQRVTIKTDDLTKKRPEKKLTKPLPKKSARGHGRISVRHRGGRHKRLYRIIDFLRHDKLGVWAEVIALEYDPNRTSNIALLKYEDGEKRYILAPQDLKVGDKILAGPDAKINVGNALPLSAIPVGIGVHNVELYVGQGAKLVRSAGQEAWVMAKDAGKVHVKLPSGEIRLFDERCYATIGKVGNVEHSQRVLGKAGASRHIGRRPQVRGVAMSAGDHPHGGGEGRTGTGRPPKTPWGKLTSKPTRDKKKKSNSLIVKPRKKRK